MAAIFKYPPKKGKKNITRFLIDIVNILNNAFEDEDDHRHIDDNRYLVSKTESENRILRVLQTTATILIIFNMVFLYGISSLHSQRNFNVVTKIIHKPSAMVVQKLYLIYTNGYTLNMGAHYLFNIISCLL